METLLQCLLGMYVQKCNSRSSWYFIKESLHSTEATLSCACTQDKSTTLGEMHFLWDRIGCWLGQKSQPIGQWLLIRIHLIQLNKMIKEVLTQRN